MIFLQIGLALTVLAAGIYLAGACSAHRNHVQRPTQPRGRN
jgi:hypothetical protein